MEQELGVCHPAVLVKVCFHLPSAPLLQCLLQSGVMSCLNGMESLSQRQASPLAGTEHRLLSFPGVKPLRKSSFWGDEDFSSLMAKGTCISP